MPHIYTISNILYVRVTSLHAFNEYGDDNDENDDDDADNIILPISVCVRWKSENFDANDYKIKAAWNEYATMHPLNG